jgi:hypothetical protein
VLPPAEDPRNPYQVEVVLPPWLLDGDPALRRWLFSYGSALRLEGYQGLVVEQHQWFKEALAALGLSPAESLREVAGLCGWQEEDAGGCSDVSEFGASAFGASAAAGSGYRKQRR